MKINEIIVEHIGKVKGGYRLYSHKGKNLGTFPSKAGAEKHEREVQYFKHAGEGVEEAKATKTRLDPKCWKGKKIGNPKTKVKGGVRVNNCVPIEESQTFDHLTNKKLRRILVSGPKNLDEVVWAMDFTDDALRADYDDEMIDSRTFDARNNAFKQAQEAFHDEDGEFNPDADIHATLAHLKQFWLV
jgi:hypothetical protein